MVIVDTKDVDQEVGKDLDPEHEKAEVEDWCRFGRFEGGVQNYGMVKISTMKNDDHGEDYAVDVVADGLYEWRYLLLLSSRLLFMILLIYLLAQVEKMLTT